jgi:hypothetical protein
MLFEVSGVLLAAIIQAAVISIYGSVFSCDTTTLAPPRLASPHSNISYDISNSRLLLETSTKSSDYSKLGEGYLLSAGIMSAIYFLCCMTTFFGTKEMKGFFNGNENTLI